MTGAELPKVRHRPPVERELPVEIRFIEGDPPPVSPNRFTSSYNHAKIAEQLRERPGVWAELDGLPTVCAHQIEQGRLTPYRPGGLYQATVRGPLVYARYVGGVDLEAEFRDRLRASLETLDGSPASAVALLAGMSREELEQYGGMPEEDR